MKPIWRVMNPTQQRFPGRAGTTSPSATWIRPPASWTRRSRSTGAIQALKGRAEIDVARREPRKALERLNRALEIDRFDTEALYTRGRIHGMLGDAAAAKADMELFKRYTNDHATLLELRGHLMTNPNDNSAHCKVAAWMLAHGRDSDGLGWAHAVLASDPDHPEANALLAGYYSSSAQRGGAGELLSPTCLVPAAAAAMIARMFKNRFLLAVAAVLVILLGWAGYGAVSARRLHAELDTAARDMASGNAIRARDRLARLAGAWPGRAEILYPLGESELACGRFEQAISAWSQIPRSSPLAGQAALNRADWHSTRADSPSPSAS